MKKILFLIIICLSYEIYAQEEVLFSRMYTEIEEYEVVRIRNISYWESEESIVGLLEENFTSEATYVQPFALAKFDLEGNVSHTYFSERGRYCGHYLDEDGIYVFEMHRRPFMPTEEKDSLVIIKLDSDLNILWTRKTADACLFGFPIEVVELTEDGHFRLFFRRPNAVASYSSFSLCYNEIDAEGHFLFSDAVFENELTDIHHCTLESDDKIVGTGAYYHYAGMDSYIIGPQNFLSTFLSGTWYTNTGYRTDYESLKMYKVRKIEPNRYVSVGYGDHYGIWSIFNTTAGLVNNESFGLAGVHNGYTRLNDVIASASGRLYMIGVQNVSVSDSSLKEQMHVTDHSGSFLFSRYMNHSEQTLNGELFSAAHLTGGRLALSGSIYDAESGSYAGWLLVTDEDGCINEDCTYALSHTSNKDFTPLMDVTAYPNPSADGVFYLEAGTGMSDETNIEIYTIMGQLIHHQMASTLLRTEKIDISRYPKGTYYISVRNKNGGSVIKVVYQ